MRDPDAEDRWSPPQNETGIAAGLNGLTVFRALRRRPTPREIRKSRWVRHRSERRLPAPSAHQGTVAIADPPPVLDLSLDLPDATGALSTLLRGTDGLPPVHVLEAVDKAHHPPETGATPSTMVSTSELLGELNLTAQRMGVSRTSPEDGSPCSNPVSLKPGFPRLESLLLLQGINVDQLYDRLSAGESVSHRTDDHGEITDRKGFWAVTLALYEAKSRRTRMSTTPPDYAQRIWQALTALTVTLGVKWGSAGRADIALAILFFLGAFTEMTVYLGELPISAGVPTVASALALAVIYTFLTCCALVRIWFPYRWLAEHQYFPLDDPDGATPSPGPREQTLRLITELNSKSRYGRVPLDRSSSKLSPPVSHRLMVNAFLEDLERTYGSSLWSHRWLPRIRRRHRPVLLLNQARSTPTGRYLVQLIEDERLRRRYPDPLLIVLIRYRNTPPIVASQVDSDRYPESTLTPHLSTISPALDGWLRARHISGTLGTRRLIMIEVSADSIRELLDMVGNVVAVRVYTSDTDTGSRVAEELERMLVSFGFEVCDRERPILESWFQRIRVAFKVAFRSPQAADALVVAQRALEIQVYGRHQAEIDSQQGAAAAKVIESLSSTERAVVQVGSLLVVKLRGDLMVFTLSQLELSHLERRSLFRDPERILEELQRLKESSQETALPLASDDVVGSLGIAGEQEGT